MKARPAKLARTRFLPGDVAGDLVEDWGRVGGLAHDVAGSETLSERAAGSIARRIDDRLGTPPAQGAPAVALHHRLVAMLEHLGHRKRLRGVTT